jgi:hypothetical protein
LLKSLTVPHGYLCKSSKSLSFEISLSILVNFDIDTGVPEVLVETCESEER